MQDFYSASARWTVAQVFSAASQSVTPTISMDFVSNEDSKQEKMERIYDNLGHVKDWIGNMDLK